MTPPDKPAVRLYWLDWLRVIAVLGIVLYHCALPFIGAPWLITNDGLPVLPLAAFAGAGALFGLPLVFLVSGAATSFSLKPGQAGSFVKARVFRLLVPLAVGIILLSPFQAYVHELSVGRTEQSFVQFAPSWLRSIEFFFNPTWFGTYGYHLWFLGFLFVYSVVGLPFFAWLRSPGGDRAWAWFLRAWQTPLGPLLPLIPLCAVDVLVRAAFGAGGDWADFLLWLGFFLVGYVFTGRPGFFAAIRRWWRLHLTLAVACLVLFGVIGLTGHLHEWLNSPTITPGFALAYVLWTVSSWSMVLLTVAVAMDYLDRRTRALDYLNEAVLPVYVLHHPLVVLFAYLATKLAIPAAPKFYLTAIPALVITFLIYEFGIRRWRVPRWLFGLKPRAPGSMTARPRQEISPAVPEATVPFAASRFDDAGQARTAMAALDRLRIDRSLGLGATALVWRREDGRAVYRRRHVTDARSGGLFGAAAGTALYLLVVLAVIALPATDNHHIENWAAALVDLILTAILWAGLGSGAGLVFGAVRNMSAGLPSPQLERIASWLTGSQAAAVVRIRAEGSSAAAEALERAGGSPIPNVPHRA